MLAPHPFLVACHSLFKLGSLTNFVEGSSVARGFADVGFEEFLLIPSQTLISKLNGAQKPLLEEERHHFFLVPSPEELIAELHRSDISIDQLLFESDGGWSVLATMKDEASLSLRHRDLRTLLLNLLGAPFGISVGGTKARALRTDSSFTPREG